MKKVLSHIILIAMAVPAFALMDSKDFTATVVGTATGTQSFVIRGALEGVYVTVPSGGTGTVTIATAQQTLFTKSCTASAFYPIQVPAYGSTGSALTFSAYSTAYSVVTYTNTGVNDSGGTISTNTYIGKYVLPVESTTANVVYTKPAMAGTVTATFVGANGAGVTNSWKATVFFDR